MKRYVIYSIIVAVAYAIAGVLGLKLAVPPGYASAVFPSSGIALAALLILGRKYSLAVFVGSTLMNVYVASQNGTYTLNSLMIGMLIGVGATLQALVGEFLVRKYVPKFENLSEEKNIIKFLLIAGPVSCVVNATFSVSVLSLFGILSGASFIYNWSMWFVGDAIGAMVFTPLILAVAETPRFSWNTKKRLIVLPSLMLFSFVVWFFFYSSTQLSEKFKSHLQIESERNSQRISEAMGRYEAVLSGAERFFTASTFVSRQEFHKYLEKIVRADDGIRAVSWNPRVTIEQRTAFEKKSVAEGIINFKISELDQQVLYPAKVRPVY